jgi:hypothetical protein
MPPITTMADAPIIIFLFLDNAITLTRCLPPKDEINPVCRIFYVESLILVETLQPTSLYAAWFISVSIRCDKI